MVAILNFRSANDSQFSTGPPNDHSCKVTIQLTRRLVVSNNFFFNFDQSEHIMGPGSHVGFPISAKNKILIYDHPMNISAKFGSNLFCGFRKKMKM